MAIPRAADAGAANAAAAITTTTLAATVAIMSGAKNICVDLSRALLLLPAAFSLASLFRRINNLRLHGRLNAKALRIRKLGLEGLPRFRVRLYTQDLDIPKGAKVVYFVRHGEAAHNAAAVEFGKKPAGIAEDSHGQHPYRDPAMTDPKLTKRGQEQARALSAHAASLPIECVLLSPLLRTAETAALSLSSHLRNGVPFVAVEDCREQIGMNFCDKRGPVAIAAARFPQIDFSGVEAEDVAFTRERETLEAMARRADRFLDYICTRPEMHIAVVTHSSFMSALFNGAVDYSQSPRLCSWFELAEMRAVLLIPMHK